MLFRFLPLGLLICLACAQPSPSTLVEVEQIIQGRLNEVEGDFAVAFQSLDNPEEQLLMNAREEFHAASTMKTPVMLEVYKQAEAGELSLDDSVLVKNEFFSIVDSSAYSLSPDDDSYSKLYEQIGTKQSLRDLVYHMIISSSNLATNIVIEAVGAENATQTLRGLGANDIQVRRGVEDGKAYRQGLNNTTTAHDLMIMFKAIAEHRVVSAEASQAMIDILLDQRFNEMIPAQLPDDVRVAHKTGWITGLHHDSGIVYLPNGRSYVLVLLSKNLTDEDAGVQALADISKTIYDYVAK
ncbi:serine hydrolase [Tunicatimonas pelagia]|uniref:serine hydrolase n=1 Tax=Tunicatimonas pelagia TaxID=931531 RepID=UPI00266673A0|nr:serine hydrolase [Tunicatimonas pelagia]WKN46238.1 class A beta-lactamase-related serine hydrolase [Tunicatimonas pelagia]